MNTKFTVLLLIGASLALGGCFGDGSSSSGTIPANENSGKTATYQSSQFSLTFPAGWDVIETKDFTTEIPRETQVLIRNNIKNDTFTANINVVKNDLQTGKNSLDYAKEVLNRQRTGLLDYKETKREIVSVPVGGQGQESYYTEFEARLNATDPVLKFAQIYAASGNSGYIVMGAWSLQENSAVVEQIVNTVKSFKVN
jgi:hypothetical protein